MTDVTEILIHWYAGRSQSEVATSLGADRKTIKKYVTPGDRGRHRAWWAGDDQQLEAADLIRIESTRLVSGIQEHAYRACQHRLVFGAGIPGGRAPDESTVPMAAVLDQYYQRFTTAAKDARESASDEFPALLGVVETSVSPNRAAAIHRELEALLHSVEDGSDVGTDDSVRIGVLIGFYARTTME